MSSASVSYLLCLTFTVPIFAWNVPLISPIFLKRYLVLPIPLSSCNSLHCSLKKAFLSLLANLWNSAFSWIYFYLSPLLFVSLLSSAICKVSSDNHFVFLHFFLFGLVLATASGTILQTSFHGSSGTLSTISNLLNPFVTSPLYNVKGFDLGHTWIA